MQELKFNLGCGEKKLKGYINLDKDKLDLDDASQLAIFRDKYKSRVSEIVLDNILEHLAIHPNILFQYLAPTLQLEPSRGKLIIITPNFFNWRHRLKFLRGKFIWSDGWHPFHTKLYPGSELCNNLRYLGMNIERRTKDFWDQEIKIVAQIKA